MLPSIYFYIAMTLTQLMEVFLFSLCLAFMVCNYTHKSHPTNISITPTWNLKRGEGACVCRGHKFIITQKGVCNLHHATILIWWFHTWGLYSKQACMLACSLARCHKGPQLLKQEKMGQSVPFFWGVKTTYYELINIHICSGKHV